MGFCMYDKDHPEYRLLKVVCRKNPAIVITNIMYCSINHDDFYFHWLFNNSHWLSDLEIIANQTNYFYEAAIYRVLSEPKVDDTNVTVFLKDLLKEMSVDPRYSATKIVRICYDMANQEIDYDPLNIINVSNASNESKTLIQKMYMVFHKFLQFYIKNKNLIK